MLTKNKMPGRYRAVPLLVADHHLHFQADLRANRMPPGTQWCLTPPFPHYVAVGTRPYECRRRYAIVATSFPPLGHKKAQHGMRSVGQSLYEALMFFSRLFSHLSRGIECGLNNNHSNHGRLQNKQSIIGGLKQKDASHFRMLGIICWCQPVMVTFSGNTFYPGLLHRI